MNYQRFKQVEKAVNDMMALIIGKPNERFFLLSAPMQSGKTQFIEEMFCELKKHFPKIMGLYVVSHNHKDFISQNFLRLEHLESIGLHCLTLKERRLSKIKNRPLKSFSNEPVVIFFDENHFGDAVQQTIDQWLMFNDLYPAKNVYLLGSSATAFSSVLRASNTTILYDQSLMPTYKSVTTMINRGDIEEATPLIRINKKKMELIEESGAFKCLDETIKTKESGYVIIRVPQKEQAYFLEEAFKKKFGKEALHIRHWNQANQIESPSEYFSIYRRGVVTIVLVQQKARMGNTIPTKFLHMVYDFSPNASITTIAQGLLGRVCGHNKIQDSVKVFTHLKQAQAYSLFEQGKFQEFYDFVEKNNLKASQRSCIDVTEEKNIHTEIIYTYELGRPAVLSQIKNHLHSIFGEVISSRDVVFRKLSRNQNEKEGDWYKEIIDNPLDDASHKKLMRDPGKISVLVDDRKIPASVYITFENGERLNSGALVPKTSSIYSQPSMNKTNYV
jgi:hypothetical protein